MAVTNFLMVMFNGLQSWWHIQHFCLGSAWWGNTCLVTTSVTVWRCLLVSAPVSDAALLNALNASPCRSVCAMLCLSSPLVSKFPVTTFLKFLCQSIQLDGAPLSKNTHSVCRFPNHHRLDRTWGRAWRTHVSSTQGQALWSRECWRIMSRTAWKHP